MIMTLFSLSTCVNNHSPKCRETVKISNIEKCNVNEVFTVAYTEYVEASEPTLWEVTRSHRSLGPTESRS